MVWRKRAMILVALLSTIFLPACSSTNVTQNVTASENQTERVPDYLVSHKMEYRNDVLYEESFYEYENGKLTRETFSFTPFERKTVVEYFYDKSGMLIKEVVTKYDENGKTEGVETTVYEKADGSNNIQAYLLGKNGEKTLDYERLYDVWGNEIGISDSYVLYAYDRFGTRIGDLRMGTVSDSGYQTLVPNVNTFYSEDGDILRFAGYSDSEGFSLCEHEFNEKGQIIQRKAWYFDKLDTDRLCVDESSWEYNEDGSYTEVIHSFYPVPGNNTETHNESYTVLYTANHIPVKSTLVNLDTGKTIQEIVYDAEVDEESWLWFVDGEPIQSYHHVKERDERGNVLEDRYYSGERLEQRTVYEYVFE